MTTHHNIVAQENLAFALMGRLHVIIRRQSGRVTDIEYMRIDPAYCRYLLKLAGEIAHEDLQQICLKLEEIYFGPEGLFVRAPPRLPLLQQFDKASAASVSPPDFPPDSPAETRPPNPTTTHVTGEDVDRSYVGRLR